MVEDRKQKKVIVTVGPSSFREVVIRKMDAAGVDLFRVNLSHTNINDLEDILGNLKKWTDKELCIDTEGAQLRTGAFVRNTISVESHEEIEFVGT